MSRPSTRLVLILLCVGSSIGCGKGLAGALAPDFSGVWDLTYDDSIDVELRVGDQTLRGNMPEHGGSLALSEGELSVELQVDCARSDLTCPAEVWPRELHLAKPPGKLDSDGAQLAQPVVGLGTGRCGTLAGSIITGEVMSLAIARAVRPEAVALTAGRIRVVLPGDCFGPSAGLPADAQVALSTGYTAAKR